MNGSKAEAPDTQEPGTHGRAGPETYGAKIRKA